MAKEGVANDAVQVAPDGRFEETNRGILPALLYRDLSLRTREATSERQYAFLVVLSAAGPILQGNENACINEGVMVAIHSTELPRPALEASGAGRVTSYIIFKLFAWALPQLWYCMLA
ncbi:Hypothetical Protein FCC1311_039852 [Hondaea fermentalgiana]|uniref:Uncharacterized protein n=1 Tax=Hondaea fermentalgiana TaxID=2315210 RepID=A0A2R5G9M8_9STRA|nr:Hypothetical Protein FCC1311_039852 [Hondaea fermentalgiana]|eukprot:GBG27762.1 Hypothetical Protein FCC1311_039852 [Hondaea fermentalgiana]